MSNLNCTIIAPSPNCSIDEVFDKLDKEVAKTKEKKEGKIIHVDFGKEKIMGR